MTPAKIAPLGEVSVAKKRVAFIKNVCGSGIHSPENKNKYWKRVYSDESERELDKGEGGGDSSMFKATRRG